MFRLCTATIIMLRNSEVRKRGKHIGSAIHSVIKLEGKLLSLYKIFVDMAFVNICTIFVKNL